MSSQNNMLYRNKGKLCQVRTICCIGIRVNCVKSEQYAVANRVNYVKSEQYAVRIRVYCVMSEQYAVGIRVWYAEVNFADAFALLEKRTFSKRVWC